MNARLYDPILGRMLSPDNFVGEGTQGFNRYSYANNNPLVYTDPSGNEPITLTALLVTALVQGTVSVAINGVINVASGKNFFQGGLTAFASGAIGGVAGKVIGLIPGISTAVTNVSSSLIGYAGGNWATGQEVSIQGLFVAGASAFAMPYVMKGLNKLWGKVPPSAQKPINDLIDKINKAGRKFVGWLSPERSATVNTTSGRYPGAHTETNALLQGDIVDDYIANGWNWNGNNWVPPVGSNGIALGLNSDLERFASTIGAQTYRQFTSGGLQPQEILRAIQNPNNSLNFNLTNFSRTRFNMFNPSDKLGVGNVTNWELYNIINTSGALNRTTFWRLENGVYEKISKPYWIK